MGETVEMFTRYGMGSFRELLIQLALDPGRVYYLDNNMSHKGAINENWGRELLELFSMGVGNYTEDDIKEASRAFTGWTNGPAIPPFPYGSRPWSSFYDATDHDDEEKEFLGERGRFNGEDIVDIICCQPATARFVARHLYNFFVADEAPVPQWAHTRPRDPELIQALADAYFEYGYDLRSMLRVLFKSDSFKEARFAKVKSPAEVVVGAMRLIGDYTYPKPGLVDIAMECAYMGQELLNPPTVEGWHTGQEWIDAGTLVERINCVALKVGDITKPGVQKIVDRLRSKGFSLSPQDFVDGCLEQLGFVELGTDSRFALEEQIRGGGQLRTGSENFARRVGDLLQLIVASKEYQLS